MKKILNSIIMLSLAVSGTLTFPMMRAVAEIDLKFTKIQDLEEVARDGNEVALTLYTEARNIGSDPIPWGFPVVEKTAPFTGHGKHDKPRATSDPKFGKKDTVGPHPHMRFFLYRCRPGDTKPEKIGESDIKHGFRTADSAHHLLGKGNEDAYSIEHNKDRSFFSPPTEDGFDEKTGKIQQHEHLGKDTHMATTDGFKVFERDHRDGDHPSQLTHLLKSKIDDLDPNSATNPKGTRWFLVGTYYVAGDEDDTAANDFFNNTNNTRWVEIKPKINAGKFEFGYGEKGLGLQTLKALPKPPKPQPGTRDGGGGRGPSPSVPAPPDGDGRRTDPFESSPSPFVFSRSMFQPETFSFEKHIDLTETSTVSPQLLDFRGNFEFVPTDEDYLFLAKINQLEFEYLPFNLPRDLFPNPLFTGINREVLDVTQDPDLTGGFLDTKAGELFIEFPTRWLNTNGDIAATSLEYIKFNIKPVSSTLSDITWESSGTFKTRSVPESSSTLGILAFGALGVGSLLKRKQKQKKLVIANSNDAQ